MSQFFPVRAGCSALRRQPHGRVKRCAAVIGALIVTAAFVGCSSSAAPSQSTPGATSAVPQSSGGSPVLPGAQQLKAALLTEADLGSPFTANTQTGTASGSTASGCPALAQLINSGSSGVNGAQQAAFTGGSTGPFVGETLVAADPATLAAGYAQVRDALHSCKSLTITSGGIALPFALSPIDFGGHGSTAVRMDGQVQGVDVNGYLAVQSFGTVLLAYYYFQLGGGSSQLASEFYTKAVNKVEQSLGVSASPSAGGSA